MPEYKLLDLPTVDLSKFPKDADGWITMFDGKTLNGWRGYDRTDVPNAWEVNDGAIHIKGSGAGEAGAKDGGDLVFAHKFKNFELEWEWKVAKGANSGVFIMIQEVEGQTGRLSVNPIICIQAQLLLFLLRLLHRQQLHLFSFHRHKM